MSTHSEAEADKIRELREKYEGEGFEVVVEPDRHDLPFDLGEYRPDLLARKGEAGILVEVKRFGTRVSVDRFMEIADEVSRHQGWRFVMVTVDDVVGGDIPGVRDGLPSWDELRERAAAAVAMVRAGQSRDAAFLMLWTTVEGVIRKRAEQISLPVERLPSSALIRHLYSHGELSFDQFQLLLSLLEVRNRVVHGYTSPALDQAVRQLVALVEELLRESKTKAA